MKQVSFKAYTLPQLIIVEVRQDDLLTTQSGGGFEGDEHLFPITP